MENQLDLFREKWEIEIVDRYWYWSGRNFKTYVETTFWYNPYTQERKETSRSFDNNGIDSLIPDWAKTISSNRVHLNEY